MEITWKWPNFLNDLVASFYFNLLTLQKSIRRFYGFIGSIQILIGLCNGLIQTYIDENSGNVNQGVMVEA